MEEDASGHDSTPAPEGLRERKKRLTRELISDTATAMFLEQGFEDVKVTDVASAAGVSEKTVYNYFPTKESLLLDREPESAAAIWRALGPGAVARSPIEASLDLLARELDDMYQSWLIDGPNVFRRFADLIDATPSLRAAERDMRDRLVRTAAEAMAERANVSPDDPEPQIAATALLGLWRIQYAAIRRYADSEHSAEDIRRLVTDDVRRAARLVESGLWSFDAMVEGRTGRAQLKAAAEAAQLAGREVASAIRQAKTAWAQMQVQMQRDLGPEVRAKGPFGRDARRGQAQPWNRVRRDQQEQWKQAYRQQQALHRQAQRELRQRFRQAGQEWYEEARSAHHDRDASSPHAPQGRDGSA
jgi:AcrR family transcriptional regulator